MHRRGLYIRIMFDIKNTIEIRITISSNILIVSMFHAYLYYLAAKWNFVC